MSNLSLNRYESTCAVGEYPDVELEQVDQRVCGVFVLDDIENLTEGTVSSLIQAYCFEQRSFPT